jgi:hypothetical protein
MFASRKIYEFFLVEDMLLRNESNLVKKDSIACAGVVLIGALGDL